MSVLNISGERRRGGGEGRLREGRREGGREGRREGALAVHIRLEAVTYTL